MREMGERPAERDLLWIVPLCAAVFFTGLGNSPLWDEDETRFASVAREMLRSGDWVVPRYNGALADKPAGLFWMIGTAFAAFGESAAPARIPSALCGLIVVVLVWMLGQRIFDAATARWGALVMGTSLLPAVEARAATADAALLAVITLMLLLASRAWWRKGFFEPVALPRTSAILMGVAAGIGILLKGLVALLVPMFALFLFYFWVGRDGNGAGLRARLRRIGVSFCALRPMLVCGAALLVALPWHIAIGLQTDGAWLYLFYGKHHIGRALSTMEGHGGWPFLQLPWVMVGLFPWSVFLPLAAWRTWRSAWSGVEPVRAAAKLLVAWSGTWLVLFSLTATQLPNYVLPAYPALSLCVGHFVARAIERHETTRIGWFYAACAGLCLGGVVMASGLWAMARFVGAASLVHLAWLGLVPLTAAALVGITVARGRRQLAFGIFSSAALALLIGLFAVAAPALGKIDPIPGLVGRADAAAQGRANLATWRFSVPGVVWSADRPVTILPSARAAAQFLQASPRNAVLVDGAGFDELASLAKLTILGEGKPLFRRGKVLLLRAD